MSGEMAYLRTHLVFLALTAMSLLTGCASNGQSHSTTQSLSISLEPQILKTSGIAFITPSSVTGLEESKQGLALAFTEALKLARPHLRIVALPETLGAINPAGLASEYRKMVEDYAFTGTGDFRPGTCCKIFLA